ncbi:hypothetical protein ALC57_01398, partial [Trachymyrmex cornetzi]
RNLCLHNIFDKCHKMFDVDAYTVSRKSNKPASIELVELRVIKYVRSRLYRGSCMSKSAYVSSSCRGHGESGIGKGSNRSRSRLSRVDSFFNEMRRIGTGPNSSIVRRRASHSAIRDYSQHCYVSSYYLRVFEALRAEASFPGAIHYGENYR